MPPCLQNMRRVGNHIAPRDLNFLPSFILDKIVEILADLKIMDYRKVCETINNEYCQPVLKFYFIIDSVPELDWKDGSQTMTLRCGKHFKIEAAKF